jgi:5-methyltetrahydrofolate--homocysteine methyltransferase
MRELDVWLKDGPLLLDGAWGTELQKRGLEPGETPDLWNLTRPADVAAVAQAYVDAGSRVILTNTFRANVIALRETSGADKVNELNAAGVRISREAAEGRALVFASIGPSGKMLLSGEVTPEELEVAFRHQAAALAENGANALLVETMTDIEEGRIAVRAAVCTGLPVIASFVFDTGKNKDRTMMGSTPEQVCEAMLREGASIVGANCGVGIEGFLSVCGRLRQASGRPVWIKANAGLPEVVDGKVHYAATPEQFASHAAAMVEAGAGFLGGCCGTSPDFIRALGATLPSCASS